MQRKIKITQGSFTVRSTDSIARYMSEVQKNSKVLTPQEEDEIFVEFQRTGSEELRTKLIMSNLRFVISVAKQYEGMGLGLDDLINEGNIGLMTAIDKFDPSRGFKFISYAVWWIRQAIISSLSENGGIVRLPLNRNGLAVRIRKIIQDFEQHEYRKPTPDEIAAIMDCDVNDIKDVLSYSHTTISLSSPIGGDEDANDTYGDTLSGDGSLNPDTKSDSDSFVGEMDIMLESLTPKEELILRKLFGIGVPIESEEEVALDLHTTKERVRQIKVSSIDKLKDNPRVDVLKSYL